jgi:hypothetical protein
MSAGGGVKEFAAKTHPADVGTQNAVGKLF